MYWRRRYRLAIAYHYYNKQQYQIESSWQRWETIRQKRAKEQIRKKLNSVESALKQGIAELNLIEEYLDKVTKLDNTLFRWLWQGHVDDRDGDPDWILKARSVAGHFPVDDQRK